MKVKNEGFGMKKCLFLILIGVCFYWGLNNFSMIGAFLTRIFKVLAPFLLGGVIAFILNIPMSKIENCLKKRIKGEGGVVVRTISIFLSLLIFVAIIAFVALLLIPEFVENIKTLITNIPGLIDKFEAFVLDLLDKYPDVQTQLEQIFSESGNMNEVVTNILNYCVNGAIGFISSFVSGFVTFFTAIIFSIYILSQKEYLLRGAKKLLYVTIDKRKADKVVEIGKMANDTFSKFISGQCMEAVILGVIMFAAFILCRFPYALMIAVLTAVTALIPIFGAMIAMAIGAILIAITNPLQAIIFIVVFQLVQQIEGNFIYPKVVGKSVGLSPMWTLLAITVGGNLFGIVGMLIGLPLASILYAIITSVVNQRLQEKDLQVM